MNIQVQLPYEVVIRKQLVSDSFTIIESVDNPLRKNVTVTVEVGQHNRSYYTVWEGEEYDKIGQWTDEDLKNAVIPLVLSNYVKANT